MNFKFKQTIEKANRFSVLFKKNKGKILIELIFITNNCIINKCINK